MELKNYQACAKIELLENNLFKALSHQLHALNSCDSRKLDETIYISKYVYEKQALKSVVDNPLEEEQMSILDSSIENVKKQKIKTSGSKLLDCIQDFDLELDKFNFEAGSEEMCGTSTLEETSFDYALEDLSDTEGDEDDFNLSLTDSTLELSQIKDDESETESTLKINDLVSKRKLLKKEVSVDITGLNPEEVLVMYHANRILDYYFYEVEEEASVNAIDMLKTAMNFWVEHKFPIEELEKLLLKHINKLSYSLGLLLFW